MAFARPTLSDLVTRVQQDLVSRLGVTGAIPRRSVVYILARVLPGAVHMLHGNIEWVSKQIFPDTADRENLIKMAALYGITLRAASYATATVTLTGTNGSVVGAGTTLLRSDGAEYLTDAEVTISGGTATAAVTAALAGADGTLETGQALTFESPVAGVNSAATVAASTVDGSDEETAEELLVRFLARLRQAPHGGAEADYIAWAKEVAGVTRAWVYPEELGAGSVTVRFARDNDASPIPDAGEVTSVQAYIDERRPVTATVTVVAPVAVPLDFTIALTPDTSATRAAVEAELEDMLFRDAEPGGTVLLSQIQTAIGVAEGVTDFEVTVPAGDVTHTTGQLPTMGTVTWV